MKKKKFLMLLIICVSIIVIELFVMLIMYINRERNISHVNSLNDIVKTNDGYVGVGISDFHDSDNVKMKTYEYTDDTTKEKQLIITTQSKIAKYDNNFQLKWEKTFDNPYDSTFYDILKIDNGFIVVGSYAKDIKQISANTRDALIIRYDNDGNIIWYKTYSVLSDTEFYKVIQDNDKLIVIGQSIYENMEVGNHTTGGGIIVKYDMDGNQLENNNYGGNKSGKFNDIVSVDDGYIVCGKDATNYGIVVKFKKDFNRDEEDTNIISKKVVWQRTYSNTDYEGFTSMVKYKDTLYLAGAINISNEKDKDGNTLFKYDAGIVAYNTNSKYLGNYSLGDNTHHLFNSIICDDNYLYVSAILDVDNKNADFKSMIIKYQLTDIDKLNKNIIEKKVFDNDKSYLISELVNINNDLLYIGSANDNCKLLTGCDYQEFISKY